MTLQKIKETVNEFYGIDITNNSRKATVVQGKQIYSYLAKKHTMYPLDVIGGILNLNHATIIHHVKSAEWFIQYDKDFKERLETIENSMGFDPNNTRRLITESNHVQRLEDLIAVISKRHERSKKNVHNKRKQITRLQKENQRLKALVEDLELKTITL